MWIVKVALQRPYTFIVFALVIVLLGSVSILRTPTDIFPNIPIPVVATVWNYTGLAPDDMANRILLSAERQAQTTVNDVEHTESLSLIGVGIVKYFFQPNTREDMAFAQITGVSQTQLRQAPPGTLPPFVLAFNASSVPVVQLAISSDTIPKSQLFDLGNTIVRTAMSTVSGAQMPYPYGGKQRQVQVDINPSLLRARGLSAQDVTNAITAQNLILPAGTEKMGGIEYFVKLNESTKKIDELNDLPIRVQNGSTTYVRDVAQVRDGWAPQTNIVRVDGHRAVLMSVLKTGSTSTLDIIDGIKQRLPDLKNILPTDLSIKPLNDQSFFVRASITGVVREAIIAAVLTGLMILLFLGNFRSTLLITVSIPLAILLSIICFSALGETINIMTLGGLALAVGILVDDATVTVENINYHLERGKGVVDAILEGAHQIALPALVSTLAICIVFIPMFFLAGIAKYLFVPMAEAVVFAMLASYVLSRTLVPTLAKYWLQPHDPNAAHAEPKNAFGRFQRRFEHTFESVRTRYHGVLERVIDNGLRFVAIFFVGIAVSMLLAIPIGPLPGLGEDFFPSVDAGQIKLHVRARTGTRIEDTAALVDRIEAAIRQVIPSKEIATVMDNLGLPNSGINTAYSTSAAIGPEDGDIYVTLSENHHATAAYVEKLRGQLSQQFPSVTFAFLPADITTQILNFGLPSPIDVQVVGFNVAANRAVANDLLAKLRHVPGAVDMRIQQAYDYPEVDVTVNRSNAEALGLSQQNVATNLLISLSGSTQTQPNFWFDPISGNEYSVASQVPQYRLGSLNDLATTPIGSAVAANETNSELLANVATFKRGAGPGVVTHYNAQPTIDIFGSVQGADLGYVSSEVRKIVDAARPKLARGSKLVVRGQVDTMTSSFHGLFIGIAGAIVLVYLLIVVNFQSWIDPLIIVTALPAALAGIVWMLFLTYTTINVPALTGAVMCMGVATANSVLIISFARTRMAEGASPRDAALESAFTRFRPVLMTALAMIIGMIPMALGLGDGGEQNAPLGRAVIGGLLFATVATLFFVPTVFTLVHDKLAARAGRGSQDEYAH